MEGLIAGRQIRLPGPWTRSPDEGGLPSGVLAHQQDHGLVVEISILQGGRVKLVEAVMLFQGQQLALVEFLEPLAHCLKDLGVLPPAVVRPQPAEHRGCCSPPARSTSGKAQSPVSWRPWLLGGRCSAGRARRARSRAAASPGGRAASESLGATSRSPERTLPKLLGPSFIQQPRPVGEKISGLSKGSLILEIKVKPVIKPPDVGIRDLPPDLSCSGQGTVRG